MSELSSDQSVNSEFLNLSASSDEQHIKPLTIKINSPCADVKMSNRQLNSVGNKSVTIINSPLLSRASSSMSLASSSVPVEDVRHLNTNYEHLLQQATASIKKLTRDKKSLEAEQDRLLTVNLELAGEVKRLLTLDKDNKEERKVSRVMQPSSYSHATDQA